MDVPWYNWLIVLGLIMLSGIFMNRFTCQWNHVSNCWVRRRINMIILSAYGVSSCVLLFLCCLRLCSSISFCLYALMGVWRALTKAKEGYSSCNVMHTSDCDLIFMRGGWPSNACVGSMRIPLPNRIDFLAHLYKRSQQRHNPHTSTPAQ